MCFNFGNEVLNSKIKFDYDIICNESINLTTKNKTILCNSYKRYYFLTNNNIIPAMSNIYLKSRIYNKTTICYNTSIIRKNKMLGDIFK